MTSSPVTSQLISLIFSLPLYAVWLVGIIVALVRWGRHRQASAIVAASLAGLLVLNVAQRVGSSLIISSARSSGQPLASLGIYLGVLGLAATLLRATAWGAVLVALFGWRQPPPGKAAGPPPFQFSIRGLMILTLAVALLCGAVRGLIVWLGESAGFLLSLIDDIPIVICWIVGMRVAVQRWDWHPEVSRFAVLGIGISLAVLLLWQFSWLALVVARDYPPFALLSFPLTLIAAGGWTMVLIAAFGWRETAATPWDHL